MEKVPELTPSDLVTQRLAEKKLGRDFKFRRYLEWDDTYELYRNKVKTNRLTQRQAVNIPLMKETIKTLLSKIDEPPSVEWKEKGGDEMKEIYLQAMWDDMMEECNLEMIDLQDKKTVLLYGRGFKKLNWTRDGFETNALDIYDVLVDPMVDPTNIETARFVIHQNIFRSLREVMVNDNFTIEGRQQLEHWLSTPIGMVVSGKNRQEWELKNRRMLAMGMNSIGVNDSTFRQMAGGDVVVSLTEQIYHKWTGKEFERYVITYADDMVELQDDPLKDVLGVDFYPYVTWGDDLETNDFWSDGVGDLVRTPNKVMNIWFSQLVENRTLQNFQMHWYDSTQEGYQPQTYEPGAGRMLPAPGDPNKTIMPVQVNGLDESMKSMDYLIQMVERATAATAVDKGEQEPGATTLGEVQILVGKANERIMTMAKFYRRSWLEFAYKWYGMMQANQSKRISLYKSSSDGKMWPKHIYPSDWKSVAGYKAIVRSSSEQEQEKTEGVQRFMFLLQQFPNNAALRMIGQKRSLELVDLNPEELRAVEEEEKKNQQQQAMMPQGQPTGQPGAPGAMPQQPPMQQGPQMNAITQKMNQLGQMQHG